MKGYTVTFEKAALKFLRKQDKITQERLMKAVKQLPNGTDIKRLQGYDSLYRTRVGNLRILYSIKEALLCEARAAPFMEIQNRNFHKLYYFSFCRIRCFIIIFLLLLFQRLTVIKHKRAIQKQHITVIKFHEVS